MQTKFTPQSHRRIHSGFTLVETLVVMAIIAALVAFSGPALQALNGAGTVNKAVTDLTGTLEAARAFAMANRTYVRVAIGDADGKATIVLPIYSADGTDSAASMNDAAAWRGLNRPLVLNDMKLDNELSSQTIDISGDKPAVAEGATSIFSRNVAGMEGSNAPNFSGYIQFAPNGEATVGSTAARYVKLGFDRIHSQPGQNPFVVRLSGTNGTITVLRKEDGLIKADS